MDISKIPSSLIKGLDTKGPELKGLDQKHSEQLQALSKVLNLVVGKTLVASVTSTQPVSQPEREVLLKQTTAALTQLQKQAANPATATPAVKAEINRLTQQQQLLQSPNLKWVDLQVNNRQLTTYSNQPIQVGQPLLVQLQGPQKLVLLDNQLQDLPEAILKPDNLLKPEASAALQSALLAKGISLSSAQVLALAQALRAAGPSGTANPGLGDTAANQPATGNTALPTQLAKPDLSKLQAGSPEQPLDEAATPPATKDNRTPTTFSARELAQKYSQPTPAARQNPATQAAQQLVGENLRRLLPHKDAPEQLFAAIQQLQRVPEAKRQQLLPVSVEQALKSLATRLRTPEQLSQPKQLAQAVKDSGVFFEKKLQGLAETTKPQAGETKPTNQNTNTANQSTRAILQDTKGALLNLLNKTSQELTGKPLTSAQTYTLLQSPPGTQATASPATPGLKSELAQSLAVFIRELVSKPGRAVANKEQRIQLLNMIQQQSLHSLAKIQLQQLHGVHQELESRDSTSPTGAWQIEIPLRHQAEVQQLQLHIERDWAEDKSESEAKAGSAKIRQWSVTLRFDLPTLGEFCAQLAVAGAQVNATLWASRENTFAQARQQLDGLRKQLEEEGIEVKSLQCLLGMPPEKPLALSYSLIDIST